MNNNKYINDECETLEVLENECNCPFGGDESNDCEDCIYSGDFHYVNGECVVR